MGKVGDVSRRGVWMVCRTAANPSVADVSFIEDRAGILCLFVDYLSNNGWPGLLQLTFCTSSTGKKPTPRAPWKNAQLERRLSRCTKQICACGGTCGVSGNHVAQSDWMIDLHLGGTASHENYEPRDGLDRTFERV